MKNILFDTKKLDNKKLLIMGGTKISCEIVRAAKKMGIYTVVADYNTADQSPAKLIADEHFQVNVTNVQDTVALIKQECINGVMVGFNDMLLPYYAQICEEVGLPAYGTRKQFECFINKGIYKDLFRKYGIPTVKEYEINLEHPDLSVEHIRYPVLVKPVDSSGARGISVCYGKGDLLNGIVKARSFSKTDKVLVEQYLTGREVTVNWIFQDGEYYVSCIANRHVRNDQGAEIPLPTGYTYPASVLDTYLSTIAPKVRKMLSDLNIKNGMMFMQCKIEDRDIVVYDVGYRLTGTMEYKNLTASCGYDPMQMMIYYSLTGKMAESSIVDLVNPIMYSYSCNISILLSPGKISRIEGLEEITKLPGFIDYVVEHEVGAEITENMRGLLAQIGIRLFGICKTKEQLAEFIKKVRNIIHIYDEEGHDMVLPGFIKEDFWKVLIQI